jgi:hypothetical protein
VFRHIVEKCKEGHVFGDPTETRGVRVPVEYKVLMALRILGRGNCAADIADMSDGKPTSITGFFHRFVLGFSQRFFNEYVHPPEGAALQRTLDSYAALGLPGAIGSMNCTHIAWDKCPIEFANLCKGKEKYPSVAFNCVVDHFRFIHWCSDAYFGATNDIQICGDDEYTLAVRGGLYKNVEYYLYRAGLHENLRQRCRGAYLICDAGMPKEGCFMDPQHHRSTRNEVLFAEWLESVRKDVECTFGILKARFRYLRNKVQHHSMDIIEGAMKVCCMIHNMILVYDGESLTDLTDLYQFSTRVSYLCRSRYF